MHAVDELADLHCLITVHVSQPACADRQLIQCDPDAAHPDAPLTTVKIGPVLDETSQADVVRDIQRF